MLGQKIKSHLSSFFISIWRRRSFLLRILICWGVGIGFLISDYNGDFDLRFKMRGPQPVDSQVVLLLTESQDWNRLTQARPDPSEGAFWNLSQWWTLLNQVLASQPRAVGITFYFGSDREVRLSEKQSQILQSPNVVWAARVDSEGRALLPALAQRYGSNTGVVDLRADLDGIVRRMSSPLVHIPTFALRMAERSTGHEVALPFGYSLLINFRGPPGAIPAVRVRDLMEGKISLQHLKDKIVIVGTDALASHQVLTPVGFMSRAEMIATMVDNSIHNRWIQKLPLEVYASYLFLLLLLTAWISSSYPQSVSTLILAGVMVLLTSISIWVFDTFYFWLPISAALIQTAVLYVVSLTYQVSYSEQRAWELEQEQRYLSELERLKGNFLSLISHDLKTPIAKIQAIADRLLMSQVPEDLLRDLKSLKSSSQELHRYIHTILQVSRVEARELKIIKQAVDINELIEKVILQVQPLANEKKITIETHLEPLFALEIDSVLITEVILNLIENAVKYTPSGGRIVVTSKEEEQLEVSVEDNGAGIPPGELSRIWEKFYRAKGQAVTTKGTGLGLYLVRYFIELHGGSVFITSRVGEGTKVGFRLPVTDAESA